MNMDYYIELTNVRKCFQGEDVLKELNFCVERGSAYGIAGNNGSGKTVLMKCICGFLPVTQGLVRVGGKYIGREVDFPQSLGAIIETPGFLDHLSGRRNLQILADLRGRLTGRDITVALLRVGLNPGLTRPVAKYSLGMRQRLGIAQAIMEDPELLILDEPCNGLDKQGVQEMRSLLLEEKARGKTILLSSHNSEDLRILCDRIFEMDAGIMKEVEKTV